MKKIKSALLSVYHKEGLENIIALLKKNGVEMYSTGGTLKYIQDCGAEAIPVEEITDYPSILGGRVKTLHPKVFGGILFRRDNKVDNTQISNYHIPEIDLVIVDLYPFEDTVKQTTNEAEIIEKIDIGGISLIRAAAKNYKDVLIVSSSSQYEDLEKLLEEKDASSSLEVRKQYAAYAFNISSHYDTHIFNHFNKEKDIRVLKQSFADYKTLRYGENPHQKGYFYGNLNEVFMQLHGKEISYNNLGDIDAAIQLISEFDETTFAILKHQNACGIASREDLTEAWNAAFEADTMSPFGGVFISNKVIDKETAKEINKIFFEVILAPYYEEEALEILKTKKNRIILKKNNYAFVDWQQKTVLNGLLVQDANNRMENSKDLDIVTKKKPTEQEIEDLVFANKLVKHTKSNAIVLAKNKQLVGSGTGQTSRVDALKQAIAKAREFGMELKGAVMASDAFFPFPDCVEIAHEEGIKAVIQPGGSIKDENSIHYCDQHDMAMTFTGTRHFKH